MMLISHCDPTNNRQQMSFVKKSFQLNTAWKNKIRIKTVAWSLFSPIKTCEFDQKISHSYRQSHDTVMNRQREPPHENTCLSGFVNYKGADQPAYPLIISFLECDISKFASGEFFIF